MSTHFFDCENSNSDAGAVPDIYQYRILASGCNFSIRKSRQCERIAMFVR
jgi:hypothetical protein